MEHRWSRRQTLQGDVLVSMSGGRAQTLALSDLSLGGVGVVTEAPFPVDAFATVSFSIELSQGPTVIRALSQVVHSRPTTTGFMFVDPGYETLRWLRETLAQSEAGEPRFPSASMNAGDEPKVVEIDTVRRSKSERQ